jgi:hypothetical protein
MCLQKNNYAFLSLFIVLLQVLSSCELAMDNEEWVVTMGIFVILIEALEKICDIQELTNHFAYLDEIEIHNNGNNFIKSC